MRIETEVLLDYSDVLIKPKRSTLISRGDVQLTRTFTFKHSKQEWTGIPIIAANMFGVGTFEMAEALSKWPMITALEKSYVKHDLRTWIADKKCPSDFYMYTLGIADADYIKFDAVYSSLTDEPNQIKMVCIDVANGYTQKFVDFVKQIRDLYPELTIVAGNVATGEMVEELILSGADIVKVGIGPGSVCTTRVKTGVGIPQLSAVIEASDAAHGLKGHIIADGGCTVPADVVKAFGAGADFVMLGGMLAGHAEGTGEFNSDSIDFFGSSSETAQRKSKGYVSEYVAAEGKSVKIPYKGPVKTTIQDILGGLRSACTYVGASQLKELSKRTTFVRVNNTHNRIFGDKA